MAMRTRNHRRTSDPRDLRRWWGRRPATALVVVAAAVLLGLTGCHAQRMTRIGTFTPQLVNGTTLYRPADVAAEAEAVGVRYARVQQPVGKPLTPDIAALRERGITAHLVAKSPEFGRLPSDLDAYRRDLGTLLDTVPTPLLAVQNEETVDKFWVDTMDNYIKLLRAAAEVANAKDIPITNGGIDRQPIALVTWNHLRLSEGTARADKFIDAVFDSSPAIRNALTGVAASDADPYRYVNATVSRRWKDAEYLLSQYGTDGTDVPVDYVNFHWYVSDDTPEGFRGAGGYTDTQALEDVVTSIEELTGKPAVTNEIGQWGQTPDAVTSFLGLLRNELDMPWVIWFDADGVPADGLHEPEMPGALRPNGVAFARFLSG